MEELNKAYGAIEQSLDRKQFICGVIEGFYGRPWTTEQRKDLFRKLQKWGMGAYVYAPKDDYKHRAFWRDLYTVEEADHLTSLIAAAKERGIMFYYALSPGLDMSYSSPKEILSLKRKLDQVSQFGCEGFALLFDDIESELSKADKEVFQTFSNAQVSVTNEIYTHLGNPRFLFCPTQYCTSRATPTVHDSEYLNTLGSKLNNEIDIMWTGSKVISKIITLESIREITEVLRRPPVIWDNLHANDYDQKRVFLGPYSGRSPELIPHLRGVMTNPNCEFHANTIAIHTLASWSKCSLDAKLNSSLSADIKLETENDDGTAAEEEDLPAESVGSKSVYHPRVALKNAVKEWLSEFVFEKEAWGPIMKPQPQVTMVMPIIPIIPSINTCMSLTTTTTTSTNAKTTAVPEVSTTQLQALADVCSTVNSSAMNPISNPIMNSLVSPTKVVTNDDILNPISSNAALNIELPKKIPISIVSVPIMHTKEKHFNDSLEDEQVDDARLKEDALATTNIVHKDVEIEEDGSNKLVSPTMKTCVAKVCGTSLLQDDDDVSIEDRSQKPDQTTALSTETVNMVEEHNLSPLSTGNEPMECSSSLASQTSPKGDRKLISEDVVMADTASVNELNNTMQVESSEASPLSNADMKDDDDEDREKKKTSNDEDKIGVDDLYLLCDLFYLPFEHGSRGYKLLNEFNWLKANASVLLGDESKQTALVPPKPEVAEWLQRAGTFAALCGAVHELLRKISLCANKEICHDLFSYLWDIASALSLLNAFIKWLSLGYFPPNVYTYTQGSYTWFSKGWKEAFMSGDQEPWVFRGGLTADFQRLMPVDSGNDLFFYMTPELPTSEFHLLRPFTSLDETDVNQVCTRGFLSILFGEQDSANVTLPDNLSDLISDSIIGPFVTLNPELCCLATDAANSIVGYAAAALDVKLFVRNLEMCWLPAMREKYTQSELPNSGSNPPLNVSDKLNDLLAGMVAEFQTEDYQCPPEVSATYPAVLTLAVLDDTLERDHGIARRLLTVTLAALRANGCFGAHVRVPLRDLNLVHYFSSLGFAELPRDMLAKYVYLGRRF